MQAAAVVVGRFVDKTTDAPARVERGGTNEVASAILRSGGNWSGIPMAVKAEDATFRLTGVPTEAANLSLRVESHLPCRIGDLRLAAGQVTDVGDVALDPGGGVRVRLLDAVTGEVYSPVRGRPSASLSGQSDSLGDSWGHITESMEERGVCVYRPVPADLRQARIEVEGCEPILIESLPAADGKGFVDLGDRKVSRKNPTGDPTGPRAIVD